MEILRNNILALTLALYRVSERIPQEEPLRKKIREKANEILELVFSINPSIDFEKKAKIKEEIRILGVFFKVASEQNWVNPKNFKILLEEYKKIYNLINELADKKLIQEKEKTPKVQISQETPTISKKLKKPVQEGRSNNLLPSERQKRILELIYQNRRVSLEELRLKFSDISQRTLRRDLEKLIKERKIVRKRLGKKDVIYEARDSTEIGQYADIK